jgi:transposase
VVARGKHRQFPMAFNLTAIKRAEGGEGVLPVARKLGISRKPLHDWTKASKAHGPEGLNHKPGPSLGPEENHSDVAAVQFLEQVSTCSTAQKSATW